MILKYYKHTLLLCNFFSVQALELLASVQYVKTYEKFSKQL